MQKARNRMAPESELLTKEQILMQSITEDSHAVNGNVRAKNGAHLNGHAKTQPAHKRTATDNANRNGAAPSGKMIDGLEAQHGALRHFLRDGDGDKIRDARRNLETEHFQQPQCRTIAEVIWKQFDDNAPLDAKSIGEAIKARDFETYVYFVSHIAGKPEREPDFRDSLHTVLNWKLAAQSTLGEPRLTRLLAASKPIREIAADEIPAPSLSDDKGNPEYDPAQLRELLHPSWPVQNLTTHAAHAQRIRDHIGADLCYSPHLGWLVYNGRFWQRDDKHATKTSARVATLTQAVRDEAATLYGFAAALVKVGRESDVKAMSKAATALLRHTKQVESKAFIEGALHLAAGLLAVETEQFDQKPWLIGFQNGTWDKGVWREHRREDFLLHLSPVHLDFDSERAEWTAALDRITGGDCDFALMAQDVAGYIFSGASHLRLLPFFYGPKGTGKSTFAELLQTVLRDMAATIDPKKLQDSAARERLGADLWNRRLAVCSEAGSQKLEAELLKTLSGSDQLAVRFLFREAFTAPPRHVLLMVTNDPPRMDAYDEALKDRIIALPFNHPLDNGAPLQLTGGRRIEAVRQDHESPLVRGFAAWAMEGLARVWENQEIHRAACAATATAKFWADTDQLTPFWESIEESELRDGIGKTELRKRYETWCETEGARPFNRPQWARACASHGLQDEKRTEGKRFWYLPKVAQVAQVSTFSKGTREEGKLPHGQFENKASCATCATIEPETAKPRATFDAGAAYGRD